MYALPLAGIGGVLLPLTFAVEPEPTATGSASSRQAASTGGEDRDDTVTTVTPSAHWQGHRGAHAPSKGSTSSPVPTRPYFLSFVGGCY